MIRTGVMNRPGQSEDDLSSMVEYSGMLNSEYALQSDYDDALSNSYPLF